MCGDPEDLLRYPEFFGHVKGAFTGALRDRIGRFELADEGTLFLDEVGEIPLELQGKLLRVIQESQFERLGEEKTRRTNVRIVAATNRNLELEVREGRFRQDLYFRLNVFPIRSTPLRERPEDIPLLVSHLLDSPSRNRHRQRLSISEADMELMQRYDWPGNVRELQNVLERALIVSRGGRLKLDLPATVTGQFQKFDAQHNPMTPVCVRTDADRREAERDDILKALRIAGGKVSGPNGAAQILGLKPTTLASRLKKLGIDAKRSW